MEKPAHQLPSPSVRALASAAERFCDASTTRSPRQAAADLIALRSTIDRLELSFSVLAALFANTDEPDITSFTKGVGR